MNLEATLILVLRATSIQLTLLLQLVFFVSCNRVQEIPEPDFFADSSELPALLVQVVGDSGEIDVLNKQNFSYPVTIEFGEPSHGRIFPKTGGRVFIYRPNPGFFGKDTIPYNLCRSSDCRSGKIIAEAVPDPAACYPVYSIQDTVSFNLVSFPGLRSVPLFPGDVYCPSNSRKCISNPSGISGISINDSIRFKSNFSRSQKRDVLLAYVNSDSRTGEKKRFVKISLQPDGAYCDSYFQVSDQENSIFMDRDEFILVNKSMFRTMIQACDADVDPDFFELRSSPNIGIIPLENESFKVFYKPYNFQGPGRLIYRYRNIRGITDEGSVRIILH